MSLATQVILLTSWVPASGFCLIKPLIWLYERSEVVVGTVESPHKAFFAILQLLFKLLVESLFQFLELSHFICLAHEHAHSSSTLWSRHRTSKQPWFYRSVYFSACENAMSCSTHFKVFMQGCTTLGERTACLIKPHPSRSQGKTQAFSSVPLCRQSLRRVTLHKICCYKEKGLGRTNNFHRCGDSVPVFCAKITCSWCICERPFIQTK